MERHDNVFTKKCISVYFNDTIPRHKIVITCNEMTPSPPNKCLIYLPLPGTGGIHFEYSEVQLNYTAAMSQALRGRRPPGPPIAKSAPGIGADHAH